MATLAEAVSPTYGALKEEKIRGFDMPGMMQAILAVLFFPPPPDPQPFSEYRHGRCLS